MPVLPPIGLDPAHPFPQLANKNLYLIVRLTIVRNGETQRRLAVDDDGDRSRHPASGWRPA